MNNDLTGTLAVLGSILSIVSVLYGIAQALQKADAKYVSTLQERVIEDGKRITALEESLKNAGIDRQRLTDDLVRVTELLMDAQRQLAETTRDVRADIAETTGVAKEAAKAADAAYIQGNHANEKIAELHEQFNEAIKANTETKANHDPQDEYAD